MWKDFSKAALLYEILVYVRWVKVAKGTILDAFGGVEGVQQIEHVFVCIFLVVNSVRRPSRTTLAGLHSRALIELLEI